MSLTEFERRLPEARVAQPGISLFPLVSVIIPAFNCEKFIAEAINSALAQDYPNIEIVVVNDGSTDTTKTILESYGDKIRLLSQTNKGCAAARNLGLKHAQGVYIAFLDGDDVWWEQKISYQIQALAKSGFRMGYSRFAVWHPDSDGQYPPAHSMFSGHYNLYVSDCALVTGCTYSALLLDCIVWTSTVMVEKSVFDEVAAFDESLELGEDYDLWLRLSRRMPMLGLEKPTALYRSHPESITRKVKTVNFEYLVIARALGEWGDGTTFAGARYSGAIRARLARSMFCHGYAHYKNGDPRVAAASFLQSIRHGDVRLKSVLLLVISKAKSLFLKR